jgi:GGDEF domain-containing protein
MTARLARSIRARGWDALGAPGGTATERAEVVAHVAMFTAFARRRTDAPGQAQGRELSDTVRQGLPMRFEAVGEALASGRDVRPACGVVGRDVARDGAALGEALSGLRTTYALVCGREPDFAAAEALSVAWSEATLEYLHDLSCEDPLTGLTSLAHVRTRLSEIYRESELTGVSVRHSHALVVVEVCFWERDTFADHHFTRALRLVQVVEAIRTVFSGGETLGRLGLDRAVAIVPRTPDLGTSVGLLRELLDDVDLGAAGTRVWIEGLPVSASSATRLLDELSRG